MAFGSGMMEGASELRDHTGRSAVVLRTREVGQLNPRNADGDELTEVAYRSLGLGAIPAVTWPRADAEGSESFVVLQRGRCGGCGCSGAAEQCGRGGVGERRHGGAKMLRRLGLRVRVGGR